MYGKKQKRIWQKMQFATSADQKDEKRNTEKGPEPFKPSESTWPKRLAKTMRTSPCANDTIKQTANHVSFPLTRIPTGMTKWNGLWERLCLQLKESEADALSDPHWVEREKEIPLGGAIPTTLILRGEKFTASPAVCSATTEAVTVCIKRAGSEQMPPTEKKKKKHLQKRDWTNAIETSERSSLNTLFMQPLLYPWQQENKTTHQHNASSYHMEACLVFCTSFLPSHFTNVVFFPSSVPLSSSKMDSPDQALIY